jgi:hypothetical protein
MLSNSCHQAAGGSFVQDAPSACVGKHALATEVAPLPTGEKKYWLKMNSVKDFDVWNTDHEFKLFCNYLNNYANQAAPKSGFESLQVLFYRRQPAISHALLATDGFVLGNIVRCNRDEEVVKPSRYAVYEVPRGAWRA